MMKDMVCCPPRVDTFLAVTDIEPSEPEKPRKTVKEIERKVQELGECLSGKVPEDFWT